MTTTLQDTDSAVTIKVGFQLLYSHPVHGSVGSSYRVEYDKNAFELSYDTIYDNPDAVAEGMCGADSAVQTVTLRALKKGQYTVKVIHEFRGDVERVVTYKITVK
ncbi:MAG: hypothetical protein NC336_08995 [Clostridium sp.]|nr:hypothetical protein [Clostridium sp.]